MFGFWKGRKRKEKRWSRGKEAPRRCIVRIAGWRWGDIRTTTGWCVKRVRDAGSSFSVSCARKEKWTSRLSHNKIIERLQSTRRSRWNSARVNPFVHRLRASVRKTRIACQSKAKSVLASSILFERYCFVEAFFIFRKKSKKVFCSVQKLHGRIEKIEPSRTAKGVR